MLTPKQCLVLEAACTPCTPEGKVIAGGFFGDLAKKVEVLKTVAGELTIKGYKLGEVIDVVDRALVLIDAVQPQVEAVIEQVKTMIDANRLAAAA